MKLLLLLLTIFSVVCQLTAAFVSAPATAAFSRRVQTRRYNFFDNIGSFIKNFGREVSASHILIGPRTMKEAEAKAKLQELKEEINDDPVKFAEVARQVSTCPSRKVGGDLGTFGPGVMVKNFDRVCFEEKVGVVHGPVSTQFGEHLIFIKSRSGDDDE
jgi:peptidyl-prolyl cis-trans isomerase C